MEDKLNKIKKSTQKVLSDTERIIRLKEKAERKLLKLKQQRIEGL